MTQTPTPIAATDPRVTATDAAYAATCHTIDTETTDAPAAAVRATDAMTAAHHHARHQRWAEATDAHATAADEHDRAALAWLDQGDSRAAKAHRRAAHVHREAAQTLSVVGDCDACETPSDSLVPMEYDGPDGTRVIAMVCPECAPEGETPTPAGRPLAGEGV